VNVQKTLQFLLDQQAQVNAQLIDYSLGKRTNGRRRS